MASALSGIMVVVIVLLGLVVRSQEFTCDDRSNSFVSNFDSDSVEHPFIETILSESRIELEDADFMLHKQDASTPKRRGLGRAGDHDLILGDCEGAEQFDNITSDVCTLPQNGSMTMHVYMRLYNASLEIFCIRVIDTVVNLEGEDTGGYPFVDDGGIGFEFVDIRMESQKGQGMKFLVEVFMRLFFLDNPENPGDGQDFEDANVPS